MDKRKPTDPENYKKIKVMFHMTREIQNKALQIKIRKLAPDAIGTMGELLRDQNTKVPLNGSTVKKCNRQG